MSTLLEVNLARKDITEIAKSYIDNTTIHSIYITTNGSLPEVISYEKFIIITVKSNKAFKYQLTIFLKIMTELEKKRFI